MKAKLIIDMPDKCATCCLLYSTINIHNLRLMYICNAKNKALSDVKNERPEWCPLIPIEPLPDMRNATSEERQAVNKYISSISHETGIDFQEESEVE